jgi:hypothetical protein
MNVRSASVVVGEDSPNPRISLRSIQAIRCISEHLPELLGDRTQGIGQGVSSRAKP